ncbi:MAG: transcriptional regulator GcvA [Alphaproteobacteria bacterium]|jgi:LysR family glycine cleavage system transcriptional activator|nr:transcriptional regulator GcvA [Alphaproteobacteria bacterium]
MRRHLPPLNALRAFEAAARHLSFSRAAAELHVTPAAVSHQVKALEDWLGVRLFRRLTRGIVLTDAGHAYLPGLTDGFDRLAEVTDRVAKHATGERLRVSALPSFATRWLVPRLADFRRRHREIEVAVEAAVHMVDFVREEVDVAVRYGRGRWPGLHVELFLTEDVFPVCSPMLLTDVPPLRCPADLRHQTLLHDSWVPNDEPWMMWATWLEFFGITDIDPARGPSYSDSLMLMEACTAGHGVAIGRESLIEEDLAKGRLVKPFDVRHPASFSYYFVCPPDSLERRKTQIFRSWLFGQAARPSAPSGA